MGTRLAAGQSIDLVDVDGSPLERIVMGIGWDVSKGLFGRAREVDLDASAMVFDVGRENIDTVWFRQLRSYDSAIVHSGRFEDDSEVDDQLITVDLTILEPRVATVVFAVSSFSGRNFSKIANTYCRLVDLDSGHEVTRYALGGSGSHTAQIMVKLVKRSVGWSMTALGHPCDGRTFRDLIPAALTYV